MSTPINSNMRQFVSGALGHIQNKVATADSVEYLIEELVSQLPFRDQLSIVYQGYGQQQAQVIISASQPLPSEKGKKHWLAQHEWVQTAIQQTGLGEGVLKPKTDEIAADKDFCKYQDVAIVPMRLNGQKNIGAFVLHSDSKYFDKEDINSLDKLSDRMAFFIQNNLRRRRNRTFSRFTNDALSKRYASEAKLLQDIIIYLNEWFAEDTIYLMIRDPLDKHQYFLVNEGFEITEGHRAPQKKVNPSQLAQIAFDETMLREDLKISKGILLHRAKNNQFSNEYTSRLNGDNKKILLTKDASDLDDRCHSWLGATMHLNDKRSLGHIILHNSAMNAYQFEDDDFLDSMADFAALLLGRFREQEKYKMIDALNDFRFGSTAGHTPDDLYTLAFEQIHTLYGVNDLQISLFDRKNMLLQPIFEQGNFPEIPNERNQEYSQFVLEKGASNRQRLDKHMGELIITLADNKKYLLVPMRINRQAKIQHSDKIIEQVTHRAIGCFVLPATNVGDFTASTIDDLSDVLAGQINSYNDNERRRQITEQSHEVANLEINNLTQTAILKLAHKFVAESMFSENFYFALYDKAEDKISFPLIFKNNERWAVSDRIINRGALGKTEAIIHSRETIHHHTQEESIAWYSSENHEDYGNDPLASWIGVPVFLDGNVIGVIATYHPTLDWVYTQQDEFFLESVATQVSGLFRAFRLSESKEKQEEANRQLEEAQKIILNQENSLTSSLLSQDLTHRISNSLGGVLINLEEIRDTKLSANREIKTLASDSINLVSGLLVDCKQIISTESTKFNLTDLLEKVTSNVLNTRKIPKDVIIHESYPRTKIAIRYNYRALFNNLYSIIDNAAKAIIKKIPKKNNEEHLYIKIKVTDLEKNVQISISDNGIEMNDTIKENLFEIGNTSDENGTGYGLWRAHMYFKSFGGEGILYSEKNDLKTFTVNLPKNYMKKKKFVYIVDDEASWIKILTRWMKELDYSVVSANSLEEIKEKAKQENITPCLAIVDLSMDATSSKNIDGIKTTEFLRKKFNKINIILVSGNTDILKDESYKENTFDVVFDKITEDGEVLRKDLFQSTVKQLEK